MTTTTKLARITDTSTIGLFRFGFDRALACWRSGHTIETISHTAQSGSPQDRGVIAACDMLHGWHDLAEREAMAHGMARDEASQFISEKAIEARPGTIT
jgi:hypothetical protein